jgi:hypothetical protein
MLARPQTLVIEVWPDFLVEDLIIIKAFIYNHFHPFGVGCWPNLLSMGQRAGIFLRGPGQLPVRPAPTPFLRMR